MDGRIFISSVQKEFEQERKSLRSYIESDPLLRDFFSVYLFESGAARSKRSDEVYLSELDKSGIYLCLIGNEYGSSDIDGISPTQREYEHALKRGKKILVFVKESKNRAEKENEFLKIIESQFVRKKFLDLENLKTLVYESLLELLREDGLISTLPFSMRIARDVSWNDLDLGKIRSFARDAGERRGFKLNPTESAKNILTHMGLFSEGKITNSAVLLFGKNPQRKFTTSCVKCLHLRGTEIEKPFLDTKYFDGTLFEMIDKSVDFVLSKLGSGIGSREKRGVLPFEYEIPRSVIFEAIANAVAHRNYASDGSVHVMVFTDRVVIMNPGNLPSGLSGKKIFEPHESLSPN
ncbi:MAG: DUF4062 domain-containing protein, partial [Opitutales bacterium]|nr:DUF4062 domain-containing protein [Opitutales bacterium]